MTIVAERLKALHSRMPEQAAVYLQFAGREDVLLTYEHLLRGANAFAQTLARADIQPGEVVVLILQHGEDLVYSFWGAILHGAIPSIQRRTRIALWFGRSGQLLHRHGSN